MAELKGRRILVLRSPQWCVELIRRIAHQGATSFCFSTFEVEPVPISDVCNKQGIESLKHTDLVIWTSQHAVRYLPRRWLEELVYSQPEMLCIGPSTGASVREAGFSRVTVFPPGSTSETLLADARLQQAVLKGECVALISGEGGRRVLLDALSIRAGTVHFFEVYRRVLAHQSPLTRAQLEAWPIDCLYVSSQVALEHLWLLTKCSAQDYLREVLVLALSERLKQVAEQQGFRYVAVQVI